MVQIATDGIIIVELPRAQDAVSPSLQQLLDDSAVKKVFCDSAAHQDMKSLGVKRDAVDIVDLEEMASSHMGKTAGRRGVAKICGLATGKRVKKGFDNRSIFEHDIASLDDLPPEAL
eukprot:3782614-Amphidinium_carterae.1